LSSIFERITGRRLRKTDEESGYKLLDVTADQHDGWKGKADTSWMVG
jgi:hypothetical protein